MLILNQILQIRWSSTTFPVDIFLYCRQLKVSPRQGRVLFTSVNYYYYLLLGYMILYPTAWPLCTTARAFLQAIDLQKLHFVSCTVSCPPLCAGEVRKPWTQHLYMSRKRHWLSLSWPEKEWHETDVMLFMRQYCLIAMFSTLVLATFKVVIPHL